MILKGLLNDKRASEADLLSDQWVDAIVSLLAKLEGDSWKLPKSADPAGNRAEARKLKRIGFISDQKRAINLQSITRLFIRFVIDPIGFFKGYPQIDNPLQERKRADVASFYMWVNKSIIGALERVVEFEKAAGAGFSAEDRANMIYNMFHPAIT